MDLDRLPYLVMRCTSCHRFLTKLEIIRAWEIMEAEEGKQIGLCPCGGRQVKPTNLTEDEEAEFTSFWIKLKYFFGVRDSSTRILELYDTCVKGQELGKEYGE